MRFVSAHLLVLGAAIAVGCASATTPSAARRHPTTTPAEAIVRFEADSRLSLCDLTPRGSTAYVGAVEMPQYRDVLKSFGADVSGVRLLPEESRTGDRFGIVTAAHAILRKSPAKQRGDRDNVTDVLRDEPVWIMDRDPSGALLVHSSDGYLGWTDASAIRIVDANAFAVALRSRSGPPDAVIDEAHTFMGTPYVWGGKTNEGIDCSGLTQTSFARHGILLPRDADQQANVGWLVATRWFKDALLPGDLLFFVSPRRGNVSHVALYMGSGKYIEAAGKDVHVSSMTPGDVAYDAKRAATFGWARRVIE